MVKQGGQLEIKFHMCLIEDRLVACHKYICIPTLFLKHSPFLQPHESAVLHGVVGGTWSTEPVAAIHVEIGSSSSKSASFEKLDLGL